MKPTALLVLCFVFTANFCKGQNLVPNPSFEDYTTCPFSTSSLQLAVGWKNPTGYSPDYFNACDTGIFASVPNNSFGSRTAHTGDAYVGIISMIESDSREYIQTQINQSLIPNHTYRLTFYVAVGDISLYSVNNIGAYFSDTAIYSKPSNSLSYLPFLPQIENDPIVNPVNVKGDWIEVTGSYTASGSEKWITIGNFRSDNNTDTTRHINGGWNASYHYIDDISLVDLTPSNINDSGHGNFQIFPNPSRGKISIVNGDMYKVKIFDSYGTLVYECVKCSASVDLTELQAGIYLLQVDNMHLLKIILE